MKISLFLLICLLLCVGFVESTKKTKAKLNKIKTNAKKKQEAAKTSVSQKATGAAIVPTVNVVPDTGADTNKKKTKAAEASTKKTEARQTVDTPTDVANKKTKTVPNGAQSRKTVSETVEPAVPLTADQTGVEPSRDIEDVSQATAGATTLQTTEAPPSDVANDQNSEVIGGGAETQSKQKMNPKKMFGVNKEETNETTEAPATDTEVTETTDASATDTEVAKTTEAPATDTEVTETTEAPATDTEVTDTTEAPATDTEVAETTEAPVTDTEVAKTTQAPVTDASTDTEVGKTAKYGEDLQKFDKTLGEVADAVTGLSEKIDKVNEGIEKLAVEVKKQPPQAEVGQMSNGMSNPYGMLASVMYYKKHQHVLNSAVLYCCVTRRMVLLSRRRFGLTHCPINIRCFLLWWLPLSSH